MSSDPSISQGPGAGTRNADFVPRMIAECLGTLLLVAGGVGTAIFNATFPSADNNLVGVGHLGVALAFGLTLTLIHLVTIPIDNTSVNPARSIATAVYGGGWAWSQLWVFIVFPVLGGLLAGFVYRPLFGKTFTEA